MSLVCKALNLYYLLRYGAHDSGHDWREQGFVYETGGDTIREWQEFRCERCGAIDRVWRAMPI